MAQAQQITLKGDSERSVRISLDEDRIQLIVDEDAEPLLTRPIRFEVGSFVDRIIIDDQRFEVPRGQGGALLAAIAQERIRGDGSQALESPLILDSNMLEKRQPLESLWLSTFLDAEESLLAWLSTDSKTKLESSILGSLELTQDLVVTDARAALIAISDAGDVSLTPIPCAPVKVSSSLGRKRMEVGDLQWAAELFNGAEHESIAGLLSMTEENRRLAFAHLLMEKRSAERSVAAQALLRQSGDHALSVLTRWALEDPLVEPAPNSVSPSDRAAAVAAIEKSAPSSERLRAWAQRWSVSPERASELLPEPDPNASRPLSAWWQPLLAWIHEQLTTSEKDPIKLGILGAIFADQQLRMGSPDEARALVEARLEQQPNSGLEELLPAEDTDLTDGESSQTLRTRLLDLLVAAQSDPEEQRATYQALAGLQPLVPERLSALAEASTDAPQLAERAAAAKRCLDVGGIVASPGSWTAPSLKALPEEILEAHVRHPATREGGTLGSLQSFLATAQVPNHDTLKAYCERLKSNEDAPAAHTDAAFALSVPAVDAYISRGDKAIGARAYEGSPSFLLIGTSHLDPDSEFQMSSQELRFLIGAEMAHLRFKHSRVTSGEVWSGAIEKGKLGLDIVLGVIPVLKSFKMAERLGSVIELYSNTAFGKLVQGAGGLTDKLPLKKKEDKRVGKAEGISAANEELIVAHRAMQLTADRAGLLLCMDLSSAVRAMFLARPDYRPELLLAERKGLASALTRRNEKGELLYQDLAVRIAAMFAFYLSDDYEKAQNALLGTS